MNLVRMPAPFNISSWPANVILSSSLTPATSAAKADSDAIQNAISKTELRIMTSPEQTMSPSFPLILVTEREPSVVQRTPLDPRLRGDDDIPFAGMTISRCQAQVELFKAQLRKFRRHPSQCPHTWSPSHISVFAAAFRA